MNRRTVLAGAFAALAAAALPSVSLTRYYKGHEVRCALDYLFIDALVPFDQIDAPVGGWEKYRETADALLRGLRNKQMLDDHVRAWS